MIAVGYTRLSQQSDTSIERQRSHIEEYADERGWQLATVYDDGERASGFDSNREQYQRLRDRVRDDADVGAVVVNDKRRLARDIDEVMRLIPDLRQAGVELHSHQDGQLDLSDPMRSAIEILQAAAAHEEKMSEIEKAREAVNERLDAGHDHGRPRFGMRYNDSGTRQVPGEDFGRVRRVFELRSDDHTLTEIADTTDIATSTVQRILDNRDWYRERLPESSEAI